MNDYSYSVLPNDDFVDLRLHRFGYEKCTQGEAPLCDSSDCYTFFWVRFGKGRFESLDEEGRSYELTPNRGFLAFPGDKWRVVPDEEDPWRYLWVEFDGAKADSLVAMSGLTREEPLFATDEPECREHVGGTVSAIVESPEAPTVWLIGHLFILLGALMDSSTRRRRGKVSSSKEVYISQAVTYMEQNLGREELSVEEIATSCKLNRSYFSKVFRDVTGSSPQDYLIHLRVEKAKEIMRSEHVTIGEVAARCGYPNQLHFTRAFKKRCGVSPRDWRTLNAIPAVRRQT